MTALPRPRTTLLLLLGAIEAVGVLLVLPLYLLLRGQTFAWHGTTYSGFLVAALLSTLVLLTSGIMKSALTGQASKIEALSLLTRVVFVGLMVWFNDERFFQVLSTVLYLSMAVQAVLSWNTSASSWPGQLGASLPSDTPPLSHQMLVRLGRRMALFYLALAVANELVWRSLSTGTWVAMAAIGFPLLTFICLILQALWVGREREREAAS